MRSFDAYLVITNRMYPNQRGSSGRLSMKGYLFRLALPDGILAKEGYDSPRLYSGDVIRFRLLLFNKLLALNGVI